MSKITPQPTDAFIGIDVQNDFCTGGALAVPDGERVVPLVNRLAPLFPVRALTQDWHPAGHLSFASSHEGVEPFGLVEMPYGGQVAWPDHCVQGTVGAAFHPLLDAHAYHLIIRKGFRRAIDSYSAFRENDKTTKTGLAGYLLELGVKRIFLTGLAFDFCVGYSAVDGREAGFEVFVIEDATRAIDLNGSCAAMKRSFADRGIHTIASSDIAGL